MKTITIIANQAFSLVNFRAPLIRDLVANNCRVIALAPDFSEQVRHELRLLGAEVVDYPLSRTGTNPWKDLHTLFALRRLLVQLKPDVVLAYTIKPVIYGTLAASWACIPRRVALIEGLGITFTDNGSKSNIGRRLLRALISRLYRIALCKAHQVLLLNPDDVQEFIDRGLVEKSKAVCLGGIGIDLVEWPIYPLPVGHITFALAARLLREKGVLEYVAAARIIKARYPGTRFLLLGGIDENPGAIARSTVRNWVAEGCVEWPGHVPIREWLAQATVFVLPSYREGVPRSTQEAMAMGRPIITTDVPGCRETVIDGINGYLIPPRDIAALVDAMEKLIRDSSLISRMGAESRRLAEERFDVRKVNQRIMAILAVDQ